MTERQRDPQSLADRLDAAVPARRSTAARPDGDALVDAAAQIANAPQPTMSVQTADRIRARVLAEHDQLQRRQMRQVRPLLRWAAAAAAVLVILFGLTPLALASVPGDPLYGLKQVVEWGELIAATSTEQRAFTHLLHAERRAQEAVILDERGESISALLTAAKTEIERLTTLRADGSAFSSTALEQLERRTAALSLTLAALGEPTPPAPVVTTMTPTDAPSLTVSATAAPTAIASPSATPLPPTLPPPTAPPPVQPPPTEVWSEDAPCSNPPPPWAPAPGWRARCEGAPPPSDGNPGNSGGQGGRGGGPPPGAGRP